MRAAAIALLAFAAACGGDDGAVIDGPPCLDCDGGPGDGGTNPGAFTWRLEPKDATALYVFEDQSPLAQGRSIRVAVEHARNACDLIAMPLVEIDGGAHTVTITPRIFSRLPACTLGAGATRVVTLALAAGTWTVRATGVPAPLTLTVAPPPTRPCGSSPCQLDCDCDVAAGERCLGAMGLGGAFTGCARPCEHDRDCAGTGTGACLDLEDGHFHICDATPECTDTFPCPDGFACAADQACDPTFVLGQASRHPCTDDRDCAGGLRCVEATSPADGTRRCEAACRTGGAWCQGPHACGPATADLSGLAASDSVCGSLGE